MLILSDEPFRVAGYHRLAEPEDAVDELAQGPIVPVKIDFEQWLDRRPMAADAFLDIGADHTMISRRWIREQAETAPPASPAEPKIGPDGLLIEEVHLTLGQQRFVLGDLDRPVVIADQDPETETSSKMPGLEDLLLGRDFMTQHGLLVVIDGARRTFSILAPIDAANRRRRDRVLSSLREA